MARSLILTIFLFVFTFLFQESLQGAPIVEIANGKLKGEDKDTRLDNTFYAYRGIPYAKAPVGPLRFEVRKVS